MFVGATSLIFNLSSNSENVDLNVFSNNSFFVADVAVVVLFSLKSIPTVKQIHLLSLFAEKFENHFEDCKFLKPNIFDHLKNF